MLEIIEKMVEKEDFEQMIRMTLTLKKYERLRRLSNV